MKFQRILAPTDFSEPSLVGISLARELAQLTGGEVFLLFVEEPAWDVGLPENIQSILTDYSQALHDHAEKRLEELISKNLSDVRSSYEICSGHPVEVILDAAERHEADVISMATQGWTSKSPSGSVTERVVRRSKIPVFVMPQSPDETQFKPMGVSEE